MPTSNNATTPTQALAGLVRDNMGVKSIIDIWYYIVPLELKGQLKLDHHEEFRDWILDHVIPKVVRTKESQYGLSAKEEFLPKLFDIAVSNECPYVNLHEYPPGTVEASVVYGLYFTDFANCCKLLKHKNEASLSRKLSKCKLVKVEGSSKERWRFSDEKGSNVARLLLRSQTPPNVGQSLSPDAPPLQPEAARPLDARGQTTPVMTNYQTAVLPSVSPPAVSAVAMHPHPAAPMEEENDAFMASLQQQHQYRRPHRLVEAPNPMPVVIPREVTSKVPQPAPPPLPLGGATQMKNSERSLGSLDFGMPTHDVDVENGDSLQESLVSEFAMQVSEGEEHGEKPSAALGTQVAHVRAESGEAADRMELDDEDDGVEVDPALLVHSDLVGSGKQKSTTSIPSFVGRETSSNSISLQSNLGSFMGREQSNNSISIQSNLGWGRQPSGTTCSISTFDLPHGEHSSGIEPVAPTSATRIKHPSTIEVPSDSPDDLPAIDDDDLPAEVDPVLDDFEFSDDEDDTRKGARTASKNIVPMRVASDNRLQQTKRQREGEGGDSDSKRSASGKFFVVSPGGDDLGSDIVPFDAEDLSEDGSAVLAFAAEANGNEKDDYTARDAAEVRSMWLREKFIPGTVMFLSVVVFVGSVCVIASGAMNEDDSSSASDGSDVSTAGTDDRDREFTPEEPEEIEPVDSPGEVDGSDVTGEEPRGHDQFDEDEVDGEDTPTLETVPGIDGEVGGKSGNGIFVFFMCLSLLTMAISVAYLYALRVRRRRAATRIAKPSVSEQPSAEAAVPKTEDTVSPPKTEDIV